MTTTTTATVATISTEALRRTARQFAEAQASGTSEAAEIGRASWRERA